MVREYSLGNFDGTAIPSEPDFELSWSPSCVVAAGNKAANLTGKSEKLHFAAVYLGGHVKQR